MGLFAREMAQLVILTIKNRDKMLLRLMRASTIHATYSLATNMRPNANDNKFIH